MRFDSLTSALVSDTPSNGARQPSMSCLLVGDRKLPEVDLARTGIGQRFMQRIAFSSEWMLR